MKNDREVQVVGPIPVMEPTVPRVEPDRWQTERVGERRRNSLRGLLAKGSLVRVIEVHNGLTGLIAQNASVESNTGKREFDAMWASSLTDSASRGQPDDASVGLSSRIRTIEEVLRVTTKPLLVDANNGGRPAHFERAVRRLERVGASGTVIEDRSGTKRNSLLPLADQAGSSQDTIANFCDKIRIGKSAQASDQFMIIARVESLIFEKGLTDALDRADAYLSAGADAILIHSNQVSPTETLEFCVAFRHAFPSVPLVAIPSTYNSVLEDELEDAGVNVVIYANHLLRSAYPAMMSVAETILRYGRSAEVDELCLAIPELLRLCQEP